MTARLAGPILRTLPSRTLRADSILLMLFWYNLFTVDTLLVADFVLVFCLGAARDVPSKAEDPAFGLMSIAEYGRFVAVLSADMCTLLTLRSESGVD